MTEYDYSPEAYERYLATQQRIARWVDRTRDPFPPDTPYFNALKLEEKQERRKEGERRAYSRTYSWPDDADAGDPDPDPLPTLRSSPTPTHKRRKSSYRSDASERSPKKGDRDYIKRPENAFILFRRKLCEDRQQAAEEAAQLTDGPLKRQRQADLSKTISLQWKNLSSEERAHWETLAKEKKKEHEQMYPNYVYRPQRSRDRDGRSKKSTSKRRSDETENTVSFIVPAASRQHHGRSASAPTPPPYQAIEIPQVYHLAPGSAPTSPSLFPMISKESTQSSEISNDFNFLPTTSHVPPAFATGGPMDLICTPPEFLQAVLTVPGLSPLQRIAISQGVNGTVLSLVTPRSVGSASSSPSSHGTAGPFTAGPFTPSSALPHSFLAMPTHDFEMAGAFSLRAYYADARDSDISSGTDPRHYPRGSEQALIKTDGSVLTIGFDNPGASGYPYRKDPDPGFIKVLVSTEPVTVVSGGGKQKVVEGEVEMSSMTLTPATWLPKAMWKFISTLNIFMDSNSSMKMGHRAVCSLALHL